MEVIGTIKKIDETKTFGASGFRKREMVITTNEQYAQHLLIEFVQDKCSLLDTYQVGQEVKIGINLRGREWINPEGQAVYFNSIQGWRIETLQQTSPTTETPPVPPVEGLEKNADFFDEEPDDLPF